VQVWDLGAGEGQEVPVRIKGLVEVSGKRIGEARHKASGRMHRARPLQLPRPTVARVAVWLFGCGCGCCCGCGCGCGDGRLKHGAIDLDADLSLNNCLKTHHPPPT
jgi:hypothetical protein